MSVAAAGLGRDHRSPSDRLVELAVKVDRRLVGRSGLPRVVRNTIVGYVKQAGPRMAAALSYYSILASGPVLTLTLALGSILFGDDATRATVLLAVQRILPPGAEAPTALAREVVETSRATTGFALLVGIGSLLGFTRALSASLNVTLRTEGVEPFHRSFLVGPILLVTVMGLLWGAWAFEILVDMIQIGTGAGTARLPHILLTVAAPFGLALVYFAVILVVVPRVSLRFAEVLVPAAVGAVMWEAVRHLFGWSISGESAYARVFGPLGGVVALLIWVYLSCAILILTSQFAWAWAMERRGRGSLAGAAPRQAGLEGVLQPFDGDNCVNEDQPA